MHGVSQNLQDMLTETGSRAELVLEGISQHLWPWQCFKYFSVLNFLIENGALLNRCYYSWIFIPLWPRLELGDYEMPSLRACVCCHIFKSSFISYLFMKILSLNLQRMFMAVKTCLQQFCTHFKKQHGRHS